VSGRKNESFKKVPAGRRKNLEPGKKIHFERIDGHTLGACWAGVVLLGGGGGGA